MNKRGCRTCLLLLVLAAFLLMIKAPAYAQDEVMPEKFVNLEEVIPDIKIDLRYYSGNNFIGKRIDGYHADKALMTRKAAKALKKVQDDLGDFGLSLKIFDAYRPQQAVDHFVRWAGDVKGVLPVCKIIQTQVCFEHKKQVYPPRGQSRSQGQSPCLT